MLNNFPTRFLALLLISLPVLSLAPSCGGGGEAQSAAQERRLAERRKLQGSMGMDRGRARSLLSVSMQKQVMAMMDTIRRIPPSGSLDRDFLQLMVNHHRGAVAMGFIAIRDADQKEVRFLAENFVALERQEIPVFLEMLKDTSRPALDPRDPGAYARNRQGLMEALKGSEQRIRNDFNGDPDHDYMVFMKQHLSDCVEIVEFADDKVKRPDVRRWCWQLRYEANRELPKVESWLAAYTR